MSGDLLDLLHDTIGHHPQTILAALAAADEPLVATVTVTTYAGSRRSVRIVAVTEDVLRERLREPLFEWTVDTPLDTTPAQVDEIIDAIVRAIFGGDDD